MEFAAREGWVNPLPPPSALLVTRSQNIFIIIKCKLVWMSGSWEYWQPRNRSILNRHVLKGHRGSQANRWVVISIQSSVGRVGSVICFDKIWKNNSSDSKKSSEKVMGSGNPADRINVGIIRFWKPRICWNFTFQFSILCLVNAVPKIWLDSKRLRKKYFFLSPQTQLENVQTSP